MLEDSCERDAETESTLHNESAKEQKTPPRFMETYAEVFSVVSLQGVSGSPERAFLLFCRRALPLLDAYRYKAVIVFHDFQKIQRLQSALISETGIEEFQ